MAFEDKTTRRVIRATGPRAEITLAGTVRAGDPLAYDSGWKQANAAGALQARLIACEPGVSGDKIEAAREVEIAMIGMDATPGGAVYVAATAGVYTQTAPVTGGQANTIIGIATSADTLRVWPGNRADSTA